MRHFILAKGVKANPKKFRVMGEWSLPTSLKSLKDFVGLTGYYKRFIKG